MNRFFVTKRPLDYFSSFKKPLSIQKCLPSGIELHLCTGGQDTNLQATTLELCIHFPGLTQILQTPASNLLSRSQIFFHKMEILYLSPYCPALLPSVVPSFSKRIWNHMVLNQMISAVCNGKSSSRIGNNLRRETVDDVCFY